MKRSSEGDILEDLELTEGKKVERGVLLKEQEGVWPKKKKIRSTEESVTF